MELRDAYFKPLYERARDDKDVIVLTADYSATWLSKLATDFPKQFINCGIAEQNTISVAAGLALSGKKVTVCGINNFITLRCFEQIAVDICMNNLPVTIVGAGAGYSYSTDGPTHHGVSDLGAMMQLPIEIFNCSDAPLTTAIANLPCEGPRYVRLGRGEVPDLPAYAGISSGARIAKPSYNGRYVITSGSLVHADYPAFGIADLFRVKPLNAKNMERIGAVNPIVIEDNIFGPIHAELSRHFKCESRCPTSYLHEYGTQGELNRKAGLCV